MLGVMHFLRCHSQDLVKTRETRLDVHVLAVIFCGHFFLLLPHLFHNHVVVTYNYLNIT